MPRTTAAGRSSRFISLPLAALAVALLVLLASSPGLAYADEPPDPDTGNGRISADAAHDSTFLSGFEPSGTVTVEVRDAAGTSVLTRAVATDVYGSAYLTVPVDLVVGMEVGASDPGSARTLVLQPIGVTSIDPTGNTVAGTAAPGADVSVLWVGSSRTARCWPMARSPRTAAGRVTGVCPVRCPPAPASPSETASRRSRQWPPTFPSTRPTSNRTTSAGTHRRGRT